MPASLPHLTLSAGSLMYATDVAPSAASGADALIAPRTVLTWFDTPFRYSAGFQLSLLVTASACAANFGVDTMKNRSAPFDLMLATCELTSAALASYVSASMTMLVALSASPVFSPLT